MKLVDEKRAIFFTHANSNDAEVQFYLTDITTNASTLLYSGFEGRTSTRVTTFSNFELVDDKLVFVHGPDLISIDVDTLAVKRKRLEHLASGDNVRISWETKINEILVDELNRRVLAFCYVGTCNSFTPFDSL